MLLSSGYLGSLIRNCRRGHGGGSHKIFGRRFPAVRHLPGPIFSRTPCLPLPEPPPQHPQCPCTPLKFRFQGEGREEQVCNMEGNRSCSVCEKDGAEEFCMCSNLPLLCPGCRPVHETKPGFHFSLPMSAYGIVNPQNQTFELGSIHIPRNRHRLGPFLPLSLSPPFLKSIQSTNLHSSFLPSNSTSNKDIDK